MINTRTIIINISVIYTDIIVAMSCLSQNLYSKSNSQVYSPSSWMIVDTSRIHFPNSIMKKG
jgi:hypothetical protein